MEDIYLAGAFRMDWCLQETGYETAPQSKKEGIFNSALKRAFDEMHLTQDHNNFESLCGRIKPPMDQRHAFNISEVAEMFESQFGIQPSHELSEEDSYDLEEEDYYELEQAVHAFKSLDHFESRVKLYMRFSKGMDAEERYVLADAIEAFPSDDYFERRVKLCEDLSEGTDDYLCETLVKAIAIFPSNDYFERKVELLKDLSKGMDARGIGDLAEAIACFRSDGHLERRVELYMRFSKDMNGDQMVDLAEAIAHFPSDAHFKRRVELYMRFSKDMNADQMVDLAETIARFPSDDYFESRVQLCNDLSEGMHAGERLSLAITIAKFRSDNHFKIRVKLCKDLSEGMNAKLRNKLATVMAKFPSDDHFESRVQLCKDLSEGMDADKRMDLVEAMAKFPSDDHLERRGKLWKEFSKDMNVEESDHLATVIAEFPSDGHLERRVKLWKEFSKDMNVEESGDLATVIAEFPSDDHLERRVKLWKDLGKDMNAGQRLNIVAVIAAIPIDENAKSLTSEMFLDYLRANILPNEKMQDFVASLQGTELSWIKSNDPLIILANELIADRFIYAQTMIKRVNIEIKREQLRENAGDVLRALIKAWDPKPCIGEKLHLNVIFKKSDRGFESAADEGGPSREYLSMLFQGLEKEYKLKDFSLIKLDSDVFSPEELEEDYVKDLINERKEKKKALENLGKLFMACFHSRGSKGTYSNKLLMGRQLPDEIFAAILSLKAKDCDGNVEDIPFKTRLDVTRILCQNLEREVGDIHLKLLLKGKDEINIDDHKQLLGWLFQAKYGNIEKEFFKDPHKKNIWQLKSNWELPAERPSVIDQASWKVLTELNDAFKDFTTESTPSNWEKVMEQVLRLEEFSGKVEVAQMLAKGMKALCAITADGDVNTFWKERIRKYSATQLSKLIQGSLDGKMIAKAVVCEGDGNAVKRKAKYLQEWIIKASEKQLKQFLFAISGSTALSVDKEIKVGKSGEVKGVQISMHIHTCAFQVDFADNFDEVKLMEGYSQDKLPKDPDKLAEMQKQAFFSLLELEIESTQSYSTV